MDIIICGAGQVGLGITEKLALEGHNITVIDTQPALVEAISELYDVNGIVGFGSHPDILERAGAENADLLIAVTLSDEVNMMACQIGHSLFEIPTRLARIRARSYLDQQWQQLFSRDNLPIDVIISPELEVGEEIMRRLMLPGANEFALFADEKIAAMAIICDEECPVLDTPLRQLDTLFPDLTATVVGINRGDHLFIPHSTDSLLEGDIAYVVCDSEHVTRTLSIFGHDEEEGSRIVIAGGGNIGRYLASELEIRRPSAKIKILERDRTIALKAASELQRSVVIEGDSRSPEILQEANIKGVDVFISLTNDDQTNLLSAVLAKKSGATRTMCLVNNPGYHDLVDELKIDTFVNPRSVTVSRVLKHVRRGRIRSVHSFQNGLGEIIEAEVLPTTPMLGKKLRLLQDMDGIRIGAIVRDNNIIKPTGDLIIKAGDKVIMFYEIERLEAAEKMFRVGIDYF